MYNNLLKKQQQKLDEEYPLYDDEPGGGGELFYRLTQEPRRQTKRKVMLAKRVVYPEDLEVRKTVMFLTSKRVRHHKSNFIFQGL